MPRAKRGRIDLSDVLPPRLEGTVGVAPQRRLGIDEFGAIGLSGGGPYALAAAAALSDRVPVVGVLGGVAPTHGPDAIDGGLVALGSRLRGAILIGRVPVGFALAQAMRVARPI